MYSGTKDRGEASLLAPLQSNRHNGTTVQLLGAV